MRISLYTCLRIKFSKVVRKRVHAKYVHVLISSHHISMCKTMCAFRLDNYPSGLLLHGLLFNVGTKKSICIRK